jgi:hypothetical protein
LRDKVRLGTSGKIVSAYDMTSVFAIGADWVNSARGFMFAIGCIQSQSCHTNRCPTGVATQDKLRQRALVVPDKAQRVYSFHRNTIHALAEMLAATGIKHPNELGPHHLFRRVNATEMKLVSQIHRFLEPGSLLHGGGAEKFSLQHGGGAEGFYERCWAMAQADSFDPIPADSSKQVVVV